MSKHFNQGKETVFNEKGNIVSDVDERVLSVELNAARNNVHDAVCMLLAPTDWLALRDVSKTPPGLSELPPQVAEARDAIFAGYDSMTAKIDASTTLAEYDACGWSQELSQTVDDYGGPVYRDS